MLRTELVISVFIFSQLLAFGLAAAGSTSPQQNENDPQFIFMEIMRRRLAQRLLESKLQQTLVTDLGSISTQKVATAIEPYNVTGVSKTGFNVSKGSKLEMLLDFSSVQQLSEAKNVLSAHVWLFPNNTAKQSNETLELNLLIAVSSPSMKGEKRKRLLVAWNTADDCLKVDVTTPVQKLLKQLVLREGKQGTLSIEVTSIKKNPQSQLYVSRDEEICRELSSRNFSKPFLVLDYTAEEVVSHAPSEITMQPDDEQRRSTRPLSRRDLSKMYMGASPLSGQVKQCSVTSLIVDLTAIIRLPVEPKQIDIGHCSGSCSSPVSHSYLKAIHFSNQTINEGSGGGLPVFPHSCKCVPGELESVVILVTRKTKDRITYELEVLQDAVAKSCRCIIDL